MAQSIVGQPDDLYRLIESLAENAAFGLPAEPFEIIETHISYVLLTGIYAYKFKKAVDLGFLDFGTLEKRKQCCEEELRLNRRHAPELYLAVVKVTGEAAKPLINGDGPVLEYAVKMLRFDRNQELDKLIRNDELSAAVIDRLASRIVAFHGQAGILSDDGSERLLKRIFDPVTENFSQINARLHADLRFREQLQFLSDWSDSEFDKLRPIFKQRMAQGFIRECHGDLHLGNIVLINGTPVIFDCIEFSQSLRWIDVINDIAFLLMDLHYQRRPDLAYRLLNAYLQETGDYAGLVLLRFYMVYRAMVRAKVACIRAAQEHNGDVQNGGYQEYLELAASLTQQRAIVLFLMHGVSGTGKTTVSQLLLERWGAVRVRSDTERKRLKSVPENGETESNIAGGLYSSTCIDRNYAGLKGLANMILGAGYSVIVDATFLRRSIRRDFIHLASILNVPLLILDCVAARTKLKDRVQRRRQEGKDASDADINVLAYQIETEEHFSEEENHKVIVINTDRDLEIDVIVNRIRAQLGWN